METLTNFRWLDGNYIIHLEQNPNGFYTITIQEDDFIHAATRPTSQACKQYAYNLIHGN